MTDTKLLDHISTVRQLKEKYPFLTEGSIRAWIFNAASNGFHRCIVRIGRRVYIDEIEFSRWIKSQNYSIPA